MRIIIAVAVASMLGAPSFAAPAQNKSAKPSFAATLEAFKKDGSDVNRLAIIAAARGKKLPVPEEAERFEGRAEFAFKNAKSEADFGTAAAEYQKAVDAAPWSAANYFNLGVAQEKAGRLGEAKKNFEWYLKAAPGAEDAKEVRKRIAGLEMGIEQASSPKGRAERALAAYKESRYAGRVVQYLNCGVNLNQYWNCSDMEAQGENWVDILPRNEEYRAPNPVRFELLDAEKGIIKFTAHRAAEACGVAKGPRMEDVVWGWCQTSNAKPTDEFGFATSIEGRAVYTQIWCGSDGRNRCRRMKLVFE